MHSSIEGFTLPGMIEDHFAQACLRPAGEQTQVVGDAGQLQREVAHRRRHGDDREL
jgi:hypothetical protein